MLNYNILESKTAIQIPSDADGLDYVVCKDLFTNSIGKNINIEIDPNLPLSSNMKLIVIGNTSKISKLK